MPKNNRCSAIDTETEREIEQLVGIEIFGTAELEGIGGIYKHSYTDFIVKEITENGKILAIKEDTPSRSFSPDLKDKYTTFNLVKINTDTFDAFRKIGRALNINPEWINSSGVKDKCSISVQKVSIAGDYVKRIEKLNIHNLFFRCITPTPKSVRMGSNWGNNFTVVLRDLDPIPDLEQRIDSILDKITTQGFPNYFGLQRFGYYRPNTHLVGKALMQGDYEQAFHEYVVKKSPYESDRLHVMREKLQEAEDYSEVENLFPKSLHYERVLVNHLAHNPDDYKGAFMKLQQDLISLIISAFQSYLFNKAISRRVQKGYHLFHPYDGDVLNILDDVNGQYTQVLYTYGGLYDEYLDKALEMGRAILIAPIIGYGTDLEEFPLMKKIYEEVFQEIGVGFDIFQNYYKSELQGKGTIRPIYIIPTDLRKVNIKADEEYPGQKKLRLEFSLPKGTYATMLLREFIK